MAGEECITCGGGLVQDPANPHWYRCVVCEPSFGAWYAQRSEILAFMQAKADVAALDKVGRPTRYGVRQ